MFYLGDLSDTEKRCSSLQNDYSSEAVEVEFESGTDVEVGNVQMKEDVGGRQVKTVDKHGGTIDETKDGIRFL